MEGGGQTATPSLHSRGAGSPPPAMHFFFLKSIGLSFHFITSPPFRK